MNPFIRFIFCILAAGIAVNLSVIFVANAQSQRRQLLQDQQNQADLGKLLINLDKSLRRADVVVESQQVDYGRNALETTLLVRQYHSTGADQSDGADQSNPIPVQRVTINGDRLAVYGVMLDFNDRFADDAPEFRILRGKQFAYFSYLCGADEKPIPNQPDNRFTFMPQWETPGLTRLDISTLHPTIYEVRLWKYVWNRIPDEQHPLPWSSNWKNDLNVTFMKPAIIAVRLGHTYTAWVNCNDDADRLSWKEDDVSDIPRLTDTMANQMKHQEAQTRPAPATDTTSALHLP